MRCFGGTCWQLTDFTQVVHSTLGYKELERIAIARRAQPPKNPIRSAIVGPRDLLFGLGRMFQTLNEHPLVQVEVFRDRATALEWLKTPLPARSRS